MTLILRKDYKVAPPRLRESPDRPGMARTAAGRAGRRQAEAAAAAETQSPEPAQSRLTRLRASFLKWLKGCAEAYAAAAAYEDLSRLSDTELQHRGLSRDVLARDLNER
jgi:hypothetical protein